MKSLQEIGRTQPGGASLWFRASLATEGTTTNLHSQYCGPTTRRTAAPRISLFLSPSASSIPGARKIKPDASLDVLTSCRAPYPTSSLSPTSSPSPASPPSPPSSIPASTRTKRDGRREPRRLALLAISCIPTPRSRRIKLGTTQPQRILLPPSWSINT